MQIITDESDTHQLVFQLMAYIYWSRTEPDISCHESEKYFLDVKSKRQLPFPSLDDSASLDLTVVVPSYNEQERCKWLCNILPKY